MQKPILSYKLILPEVKHKDTKLRLIRIQNKQSYVRLMRGPNVRCITSLGFWLGDIITINLMDLSEGEFVLDDYQRTIEISEDLNEVEKEDLGLIRVSSQILVFPKLPSDAELIYLDLAHQFKAATERNLNESGVLGSGRDFDRGSEILSQSTFEDTTSSSRGSTDITEETV